VVTSRRVKDQQSGEWSDKDTTFWDCVAFGELATNVAESLVKGIAVVVTGNAAQEEWETRDGEKRRSMKVTVDDVAPSLRWASCKVMRAERSSASAPASAAEDPWAKPAAEGGFTDEPPF
jgi:single-strand DNA-binding protein